MILSSLNAISPIDGRYSNRTSKLRDVFSEYAFLKYRVKVELLWLKKLLTLKEINISFKKDDTINFHLDEIINNFSDTDAQNIKKIEKTINHDVKSIEYFLKDKLFKILGKHHIINFVHFLCTSEDINNLAYSLMLKTAKEKIIIPTWEDIIKELKKIVSNYYNFPILSRTHGQPATPSTIGKEMVNFSYRLERQLIQFKNINLLGKINGSTGNYNAHFSAYPNINWHNVSRDFVTSLGLGWNPYTTQIEPHDYISEFFSCISRVNTILLDFNQDMWGYISLNYFVQKNNLNEVGSSVMPHKINPINFENSEGNLGLSNAIINYFVHKLPISRWQRDLSDSTVLRNMGSVIAYSIIAYDSMILGIQQLKVNEVQLLEDLDKHWEILAEPIHTVMCKYGIRDAYDKLKLLTRGKKINSAIIHSYINSLAIPEEEKIQLIQLTPMSYLGLSIKLAKNFKNYKHYE
ncbi:MAG: adenylosuccinate lyase [Buchnera aphidicola (Schlechtendalia peitan)]